MRGLLVFEAVYPEFRSGGCLIGNGLCLLFFMANLKRLFRTPFQGGRNSHNRPGTRSRPTPKLITPSIQNLGRFAHELYELPEKTDSL
jgi:hypothetical protein